MQKEYSLSDLKSIYDLYIGKNKSANGFSKFILNREKLKKILMENSSELDLFYNNITDLQRLHFIFNEKIINKCKCGNVLSWRNLTKGYNKTCGSKKCVSEKNVESVKNFYEKNMGETHLFKTEKFKKENKDRFIKKYGVDNPWKNPEIQNKIKETNIERYGESSWLKVKKNREYMSFITQKSSELDRLNKIKDKNIPIEIVEYSKTGVTIKCNICDKLSEFSVSFFNKKISSEKNPCFTCNPPLYSESNGEKELFNYIKSIYDGNIIIHDRKSGNGKELDIFLPDKMVAFEYNGIYWHSEIFKNKNDNLNKKKYFETLNINVINIWEDHWLYKNDIVKSRINNFFNISNRIFARKCEIREIDSKISNDFLLNNHIQGAINSKIRIGLFFANELVSVMTLGSRRISLGQKNATGEFELLRFCNKLNNSVIGAASKLFSFFLKKYNPSYVVSYQDYSWNAGNLYKNLGFSKVNNTAPNYYWCKGNIRFNRFNFRKDKLIREGFDPNKTEDEIMEERKYYKLWDLGNIKWEFKK